MMAAIALPCKISSGTCSRFTPQMEHLLLSWQMDLSLLGANPDDGGDSAAVQDQLRNVQQVHATSLGGICCNLGRWICRYLGKSRYVVAIALPCKISSGTCSRFTPHGGACAAILADGSVVTWGEPDRWWR